jgi:hypothetical protein
MRQVSDIDLLLKDYQINLAIKILNDLGFKTLSKFESLFVEEHQSDIVHRSPMYRNGICIELHLKLHYKSEYYNANMHSIWEYSNLGNVHGVPVMIMDWYDTIIYLCIHIEKHFESGKVQFKSFSDLIEIFHSNIRDFLWEKLTERCIVHKSEFVVFRIIMILNEFFNLEVPLRIIKKHEEKISNEFRSKFLLNISLFFKEKSQINLSKHFNNLRNISSLNSRLRYIGNIAFPSIDFLRSQYRYKNSNTYLSLYFNRLVSIFIKIFKI